MIWSGRMLIQMASLRPRTQMRKMRSALTISNLVLLIPPTQTASRPSRMDRPPTRPRPEIPLVLSLLLLHLQQKLKPKKLGRKRRPHRSELTALQRPPPNNARQTRPRSSNRLCSPSRSRQPRRIPNPRVRGPGRRPRLRPREVDQLARRAINFFIFLIEIKVSDACPCSKCTCWY